MNKLTSKQLGQQGELQVSHYLQFYGYQILHQNFRWAHGEIDLIAHKKQTLIFFEIKTSRIHSNFGAPETWVNSRKQKQIGFTAQKYFQLHHSEALEFRFDVIGVIYDGLGNWYFNHLPNAFWLES